jgi:hypothetical protein
MRCDRRGFPGTLVLLVSLVVLLCGLRSALGQQAASPVPSSEGARDVASAIEPRVKVDEVSFDFGEVGEGETLRHEFKVKNLGLAELQITQVNPG